MGPTSEKKTHENAFLWVPQKNRHLDFCGGFSIFRQKLGRGFLFCDNRECDCYGLNCVPCPPPNLVKSMKINKGKSQWSRLKMPERVAGRQSLDHSMSITRIFSFRPHQEKSQGEITTNYRPQQGKRHTASPTRDGRPCNSAREKPSSP